MQVTVIIIMVDEQLAPLYLQPSLCKTELSEDELTSDCVNVLKLFRLTKAMLQEQVTGGAVGDVYVHMKINK